MGGQGAETQPRPPPQAPLSLHSPPGLTQALCLVTLDDKGQPPQKGQAYTLRGRHMPTGPRASLCCRAVLPGPPRGQGGGSRGWARAAESLWWRGHPAGPMLTLCEQHPHLKSAMPGAPAAAESRQGCSPAEAHVWGALETPGSTARASCRKLLPGALRAAPWVPPIGEGLAARSRELRVPPQLPEAHWPEPEADPSSTEDGSPGPGLAASGGLVAKAGRKRAQQGRRAGGGRAP